MLENRGLTAWLTVVFAALLASACGGSGSGSVKIVDAQYDPVAAGNISAPIDEVTTSAAQIFTVVQPGKFEEFWIALADAESADSGTLTITVRPLVMGLPDPNPSSSIIVPIVVDTATLPTFPLETWSEFDVGTVPGRVVAAGEQYAIVVEFTSRVPAGASSDGLPLARLIGRDDNGYAGGTGSTSPDGTTWTNSAINDYLFRTFILQ